MYRFTAPLARLSARQTTPIASRTFTAYPARLNKGPETSQGHATDKAHQTGHSDGDVQTASVRAAQDAKAKSGDNATNSGEAEPFDAARQGSADGSSKSSKAAKETEHADGSKSQASGAMKDQIGGQDEDGPGVTFGGKEEAAGASYTDMAKQALGFDKVKKLHNEGRDFHTSARAFRPASNNPEGSRQPKETNLPGDQNEHLKHSSPSTPDSGKGNAADTPHLPSKSGHNAGVVKQGGGAPQKKGFHTSARVGKEKTYAKALETEGSNTSAQKAPPTGLPSTLESPYSPEAIQKPDVGQTPASQVQFSSTAVDPPNEALREAAKSGTLADRNPQPNSDVGKLGNDEAWKHRK
ncbi:hypothetical protein CI109_100019 [Kwoniella shandongensis]|uniref:Uncharacterized protein n=1 Tax=Kwoniella shandongensis TaxID=1734106 RepID=A0A5M6BUI8_9TREE|nr:uncharacterized protein CI109_006008 [Kwoniella shandongensis]KAA5525700.1 hypothetical protein CI109_006008 [Kwoniella shandongensis]